MQVNIKLLGDRVLVELDAEEPKVGHIWIPQDARKKNTEGTVVAVGTGGRGKDGSRKPFDVKPGDRVLVSKYGGTEVKLGGKDFEIFTSDDIIAVFV
jgi:chaperonin GroES